MPSAEPQPVVGDALHVLMWKQDRDFAPSIIRTVEQAAEELQVPKDAIEDEINNGRLQALRIGPHIRITEAAFNEFIKRASTAFQPTSTTVKHQARGDIRLQKAPDFIHIWPDKKKEEFLNVQEGVAERADANYYVKVGFTTRHSAGKDRRRSLVLINKYPTVEFVSADTQLTGKMASIIRDRAGKRLPVGATLPPEYVGLPVGPYKDVVVGPSAPNGMAVICDADDVDTMVRHALIRFQYREEKQGN